MCHRMIEEGSKRGKAMVEKRQLFMEMSECSQLREASFSYSSTAHNGLNTLDHNAEISVSRLETILSSIYFQLNKRLPTTHQINVEQSIGLLLNFMVATYDRFGTCGQHGDLKQKHYNS
ncbi:hypothetical protein XENOCAPTIV_003410 [Xenoophorus captivus]|uniref:EF-hand domain-containing protein n=1 Tax=Xenoophorus captivus TaxID=1517983 RepID=A0ABV0Q557_9TELE